MQLTVRGILRIAEKFGWDWALSKETDSKTGKITEKWVTFRQGTPAGEDFFIDFQYKNAQDLAGQIYEYKFDFDEEQHVMELMEAKQNGFAGVPDIKTLVEDAEWIQKALDDLDDAITEIERRITRKFQEKRKTE